MYTSSFRSSNDIFVKTKHLEQIVVAPKYYAVCVAEEDAKSQVICEFSPKNKKSTVTFSRLTNTALARYDIGICVMCLICV